MNAREAHYTKTEDTTICRMFAGERPVEAIAITLDRSVKGVQNRIYTLRKMGVIAGYEARRRVVEMDARPIRLDPPLTLRGDDDLIRACRSEGGFPRAQVVDGRTFWLTSDNTLWRHSSTGRGA